MICIFLVFSLSVPIPEISKDGFTLSITGEGEINSDITTKVGDKSQILHVIIKDANSLKSSSFEKFSAMKTIQHPSEMTEICPSCFKECSNLKSIIIPNGVTHIYDNTFFDCMNLEIISIPLSLKVIITGGTFYSTKKLKNFVISRDHEYFSTDDSCSYLMSANKTVLYKGPSSTDIKIPSSVKTILKGFSYSCSMTSVSFEGSTVEEIRTGAFSQEYIDTFTPPNTLLRLESSFFGGTINTLTIPDSVSYLSESAFSDVTISDLKFSINSKVLLLDSDIFYDIEKTTIFFVYSTATKIRITEKIKSIAPGQVRALNIKSVEVDQSNDVYSEFKGILYNKKQNVLIACPGGLTKAVLSPSCKTINETAFRGCSLNEIELNEGIKRINFAAFKDCHNLTKMRIPSTLEALESWVFHNCNNLKFENSFPKTFYSMSTDNFRGGIIGTVNFSLCTSLSRFPSNTFYESNISSIILPPALESISGTCFYSCALLQSISFPSSFRSMGDKIFLSCKSLNTIIFEGDNLTKISLSAFENSGIIQFIIPSNVENRCCRR